MPNIQSYHLLFYKLSPQYCYFDHTGHMTIRSHDHSTTIAAIFDNVKNFFLFKLGMFSKISLSWLHHQLYAVTGM